MQYDVGTYCDRSIDLLRFQGYSFIHAEQISAYPGGYYN